MIFYLILCAGPKTIVFFVILSKFVCKCFMTNREHSFWHSLLFWVLLNIWLLDNMDIKAYYVLKHFTTLSDPSTNLDCFDYNTQYTGTTFTLRQGITSVYQCQGRY